MAKTVYNSQNEFVYNYLRGTGRTLTQAQARKKYGIKNLAARMSDMRAAGLVVRVGKNKKGLAQYAISARDVNGSRAKVEDFAI